MSQTSDGSTLRLTAFGPLPRGPARSAARLRLQSAYGLPPPEPRQVPHQPNTRYPEKFPPNGKLQKERYTAYRETLNTCSKRLDRLLSPDQTSPSQEVLRQERALLLAEALAELSEDQRTAVELHHLDGYSVFEISKRMDRTKAGVAGLLRRGLKDLRERLIEKGLE